MNIAAMNSRPMNITHFVENLNRGGLERVVLELVKLQHQQGHRCQVVCLFKSGSLAHELTALGIPVGVCDKRPGLDLRALARARRMIRAHATEVLHTHNAVVHYQAVLASFGLGIGHIVNTRHGMGERQGFSRREWLYRRVLAQTQAVVCVCEAARIDAIRRGIVPGPKTRVVPNGIRLDTFQMASSEMRERLLQSLGLPMQTRIIGTVGRLNWVKDQAALISAFRSVREQLSDVALILIGDGELRAELEQYAVAEGMGAHVHFLGDRSDVRALMQGLDLFALPSLSEGYSMALLEACAVGLPIVATDVGGNGEIVHDGITGCLVPPRNPRALSDAVIALLHEPQRARALGDAARAWVELNGSLETMAKRYAEVYLGSTSGSSE
jgi:glycosyltransferase involved in cell wall biosynthesis